MTFAKSCPGSRAIREPTPEYINCPNCGEEVEVWSHELFYPCPKCGTRVFREQHPSCIDWCPYAKECIGSQVYEKLRPSSSKEKVAGSRHSPLNILIREHTEALTQMSQIRAAVLCLKAGEKSSENLPSREKALLSLSKVLEFVDKDLRRHFQQEENTLFPALESHIGKEGGPVQVLLREHAELWQWVEQMKKSVPKLTSDGAEPTTATVDEIYHAGNHIAGLLRAHIERENTSLLPIAESLLDEKELKEIARCWGK